MHLGYQAPDEDNRERKTILFGYVRSILLCFGICLAIFDHILRAWLIRSEIHLDCDPAQLTVLIVCRLSLSCSPVQRMFLYRDVVPRLGRLLSERSFRLAQPAFTCQSSLLHSQLSHSGACQLLLRRITTQGSRHSCLRDLSGLLRVDLLAILVVPDPRRRGTVSTSYSRSHAHDLAVDGAADAVLELEVHLGDGVVGEDRGVRDITYTIENVSELAFPLGFSSTALGLN